MSETSKPKEHGSGSGTEDVFIVEARLNYSEAKQYKGMLLDNRWKRVHFPEAPIGVVNTVWNPQARHSGFLGYDSAMALAYWFLVEPMLGGLCVEVRLVKIRFTYSFSTKEIGVGPIIQTLGNRNAEWPQRD